MKTVLSALMFVYSNSWYMELESTMKLEIFNATTHPAQARGKGGEAEAGRRPLNSLRMAGSMSRNDDWVLGEENSVARLPYRVRA